LRQMGQREQQMMEDARYRGPKTCSLGPLERFRGSSNGLSRFRQPGGGKLKEEEGGQTREVRGEGASSKTCQRDSGASIMGDGVKRKAKKTPIFYSKNLLFGGGGENRSLENRIGSSAGEGERGGDDDTSGESRRGVGWGTCALRLDRKGNWKDFRQINHQATRVR